MMVFFDGDGVTTELTRKEVYSKTADGNNLFEIFDEKNYFKVRVDKKKITKLDVKVIVYGIRMSTASTVTNDSEKSFSSSRINTLILIAGYFLQRIFS